MVKGRYKRKLNTVFLLVFAILSISFMSIFIKIVSNQRSKEYEAAITHSFRTAVSNSQIKLEVINSALEIVMESDEVSKWSESTTKEMFYLGLINVQQKK